MRDCTLPQHHTFMRTIYSCLSLWGRCSGKQFMRYIYTFWRCPFVSSNLLLLFWVIVRLTVIPLYSGHCCGCAFRILLPQSSLRSPSQHFLQLHWWVALTGLWVLQEPHFNKGKCTKKVSFSPIKRIFFPTTLLILFVLLALWWRCWRSGADVVLWRGCYGAGKNEKIQCSPVTNMKFTNECILIFLYSSSAMSWYQEGKQCQSPMKTSMLI